MFAFWKQSFCFVIFVYFIGSTDSKSINNEKSLLKGKLLQVHVLFRHGDRTPLYSYPVRNKYFLYKFYYFNNILHF